MTGHDTMVAPTIKAYPDTVAAAFDDFMGAFETFKEVNDRRFSEVERKLGADPVTAERLDRVSRAMDEQKRMLDELLLKRARPPVHGDSGFDNTEHKAAFEAYIRRGDESALRNLEAKAGPAVNSGAVSTEGGIVVPPELDLTIGRRAAMISPMRRLATVRQVSATVLKKAFATNSLSTGWVAEKDARPQTGAQTLTELNFPTQELYAEPAATQTLLDDAAVDIEAWISGEVEIAFAEQEGTAFITGDGTNKPKGFLSYTTVADSSWAWGSLGYLVTGVDKAFPASNPSDKLFDLVHALKAGYRQNGTFMMNRKTQAEIRKFRDSNGNYLWQPPASAGQPAALLGFPLAESEEMPDFNATPAGQFAIAFGDFRTGYLIVDRVGTRILRDPFSAKPYVLFYVTKRVGGGVQNFEAIKLLKFSA